MPFLDVAGYATYMREHHWDWESAYEEFAMGDDAPATVRDDFRQLEFEEDGDEVEADKQPMPHGLCSMFEANLYADATAAKINVGDFDWEARTAGSFTDAEVNGSAVWMTRDLKDSASTRIDEPVDISTLNPAQRFVYDVIEKHDLGVRRWRTGSSGGLLPSGRLSSGGAPKPKPLRALVCGTAGSGKVRSVIPVVVVAFVSLFGAKMFHTCDMPSVCDLGRIDTRRTFLPPLCFSFLVASRLLDVRHPRHQAASWR
jgi:hypothetical protein